MRRSFLVGLTGLALLAGACVQVAPAASPTATAAPTLATPSPTAPPTASPSPTPTEAATSTPTVAPTVSSPPTIGPTATPTASGTASATASAGASPSGGSGFHADTELFRDDFADAASGLWGTGDLAEGSIQYGEGTLGVTFAQDDATLWSWRSVGATWNTLSVTGWVSLGTGDGAGGWACGSGAGDFVGGVVNNADEWVLFEVVASTSAELDRGDLPDEITAVSPYTLVIECAGTATGALRLRMQVDGVEVATYERDTGPATFDRAAVYSSTSETGFSATFDDAAVFGGTEFGGFPADVDDEAVTELLTHVPAAFAANCTAQPPDREGQLAGVRCEPAGAADVAIYGSFADNESMNAVLVELVEEMEPPDDASCSTGPGVGSYNIDGVEAGTLACGPDPDGSGIIFVWTHDELNIISGGQLASDDYDALYTWWQNESGPVL